MLDSKRALQAVPNVLEELFTGSTNESKNFMENVRQYNSALAFASQKVHLAIPIPGNGPYSFRIHGQVYSRVGSLHPPVNTKPSYCQLYVLDTKQAAVERMGRDENRGCTSELFIKLDTLIRSRNPYVVLLKNMQQVAMEEAEKAVKEHRPIKQVKMIFLQTTMDPRRYNEPVGNEIAAVFVGEEGQPPSTVDFTIYPQSDKPTTMSHLSPHMDPMVYPLLFPNGEQGWQVGLQHVEERATAQRQRMTMLQYYAYRIAVRTGFSAIHSSGELDLYYLENNRML